MPKGLGVRIPSPVPKQTKGGHDILSEQYQDYQDYEDILLEVDPHHLIPFLEKTLRERERVRDEAEHKLQRCFDDYGGVEVTDFPANALMLAFGTNSGNYGFTIETSLNQYVRAAQRCGVLLAYIKYLKSREDEPVYIVPKETFFNNTVNLEDVVIEEPGDDVFAMAEAKQRELLIRAGHDEG